MLIHVLPFTIFTLLCTLLYVVNGLCVLILLVISVFLLSVMLKISPFGWKLYYCIFYDTFVLNDVLNTIDYRVFVT